MDKEFLKSGFYTYNPLLVGLAIGYLFKITPLAIFFVIFSGILTMVITIMLSNIFSIYLKLPILSLPFAIISSIAYLAASQYSNLFVTGIYSHYFDKTDLLLPIWISGFLKAFGTILFSPHVISGIILSIVVFFASRILFLLGVLGYYSGTIISGFLSDWQ